MFEEVPVATDSWSELLKAIANKFLDYVGQTYIVRFSLFISILTGHFLGVNVASSVSVQYVNTALDLRMSPWKVRTQKDGKFFRSSCDYYSTR